MFTRPKAMEPFHIERAISYSCRSRSPKSDVRSPRSEVEGPRGRREGRGRGGHSPMANATLYTKNASPSWRSSGHRTSAVGPRSSDYEQLSEIIRTDVTVTLRPPRPPPCVPPPAAEVPPPVVPPVVPLVVLPVVVPPAVVPPVVPLALWARRASGGAVASILWPPCGFRSTSAAGLSISEVGMLPRPWPPLAVVPPPPPVEPAVVPPVVPPVAVVPVVSPPRRPPPCIWTSVSM